MKAISVAALMLAGQVSADFEPSTQFASVAVGAIRAMKQAEREKTKSTKRFLKPGPKDDEPTAAPSASPTHTPTLSPTYGAVSDFNDITFSTKQIYYSKVLQPRERVKMYEDDVFTVYGNCHAQGDNRDPASVDVVVRNVHDWPVIVTVDDYESRGYHYFDDDDDDNGTNNGDDDIDDDDDDVVQEDVAVNVLLPGVSRLYQGVNVDADGRFSSPFDAFNGFNAAIFVSDGHFLASYGEASIIIDNWAPDADDYYGGGLIDTSGQGHGCVFAGFIELAEPNENFLGGYQFLSHNDKLNSHSGSSFASGSAASGQTAGESSAAGVSAVSKFLMSTVAGVFGAFAALYVSKKRIARASSGVKPVDSLEEKEGVVSF